MAYALIASALKRAIGLDVASIGNSTLACAVQGRMSARGQVSVEAYATELEACALELSALIEAIVIPETWFFRDPQAFVAVGQLAAERVAQPSAGGKLRLISLPCSTGEEPYSLAMALLDAGLQPTDFEIHGFDVSRVAIARAVAGVYGRNSFRGGDLAFRTRHFSETPAGWRIRPEVAGCVRFAQANLLSIEPATRSESYDVVFCRNLLIYFDAATQQSAMQVLRGLPKPSGTIFVGPGEANLMLSGGFASVQRPLTFGFRTSARQTAPIRRSPVMLAPTPPPARPASAPARAPKPVNRTSAKASLAPVEGPPVPPALADARRLADLGRIGDAVRACQAHIRRDDTSAEAWRLLGVLWEAGDEATRAADCYRKALYLDPVDAESLEHLALLLQRQGDLMGAGRVLERARRLSGREGC